MKHDLNLIHLPKEVICQVLCLLSYKELMILTKVSKTWSELAMDPWLWRKFQLQVNGSNLDSLERILSMQRFGSISYLCCLHCELEEKHLREIFNHRSIKQVEFIGCDLMLIGPEILAMTVNKLVSVSLSLKVGTKLSTAQKIQMLTPHQTKILEQLELLCIDLSDVPASVLALAIDNLHTLTLRGNNLKRNQANELFSALRDCSVMENLTIISNILTRVPPDDLAKTVNRLCCVELVRCKLHPSQISAMLQEIIQGTKLRELNMKFTDMSSIRPGVIASALTRLNKINISGCRLSKEQNITIFEILAGNMQLHTLQYLDISKNDLSEVPCKDLTDVITNLKQADVAHTNLKKSQILILLKSTSQMSKLEYLNIKGNCNTTLSPQLYSSVAKKVNHFYYQMESLHIYGKGAGK